MYLLHLYCIQFLSSDKVEASYFFIYKPPKVYKKEAKPLYQWRDASMGKCMCLLTKWCYIHVPPHQVALHGKHMYLKFWLFVYQGVQIDKIFGLYFLESLLKALYSLKECGVWPFQSTLLYMCVVIHLHIPSVFPIQVCVLPVMHGAWMYRHGAIGCKMREARCTGHKQDNESFEIPPIEPLIMKLAWI